MSDSTRKRGKKFVRNQIDPSSRQVYVAKLGRMGSPPLLSPLSHLHYLRRRWKEKDCGLTDVHPLFYLLPTLSEWDRGRLKVENKHWAIPFSST